MYKKKNRTPVMIAAAAVAVLILIMIGLQVFFSNGGGTDTAPEIETETERETEADSFNILLYKNSAGTVSYDSSFVLSDTEEEAVLSVKENTLVTMMVTPDAGKELLSVDVLDYDMKEISSVLRSASGTEGDNTSEMRLSFVMPACDLFVSFNFADAEPDENEDGEELLSAEEEDPTYGLVLHNVSADVITSFNGQFDEEKFLTALAEALHIDSARSEYRTVTDVYFGDLVENDTEKLSYEIYFNNDLLWKVLATYYPLEDSYLFTEIEEESEETSAQTSSSASEGASSGTAWGTTNTAGTGTGTSSYSEEGSTASETTSFDILSVSTVFLKYCGSEEEFYQSAFDYVLSRGLTGAITGTMSDYEIDPENQTATIHIMLNTGAALTGTYNRKNNTYSFSGL